MFSTPDMPDVLPPLPNVQSPPGTAFAAAVLSGALAPKPETAAEIVLRLGGAGWSPPDFEVRSSPTASPEPCPVRGPAHGRTSAAQRRRQPLVFVGFAVVPADNAPALCEWRINGF